MKCPNRECGIETIDGFCDECALEDCATRLSGDIVNEDLEPEQRKAARLQER